MVTCYANFCLTGHLAGLLWKPFEVLLQSQTSEKTACLPTICTEVAYSTTKTISSAIKFLFTRSLTKFTLSYSMHLHVLEACQINKVAL